MYIQITTRCQMSCEHCCYSCGPKGEDMSPEVYSKALKLCVDYENIPFLGGGEPTLHPQFKLFLLDAIAETDSETKPGMITNGGVTKLALLIAKLAKANVIWAALSRDEFHDPIDMYVVRAFENLNPSQWGSIRDTSNNGNREALPHGRGKELIGWDMNHDDSRDETDCPCDDWFICPDGTINQCGCEDSPMIGNVDDGITSIHLTSMCCRSQEFVDECIDNGLESLLV